MKCKLGDLVEVEWLDAQGFINDSEEKAHIISVKNIGILRVDDDREIVLQSGDYSDKSGDYTAIPKGWQEKMTLIERRKL